MDELEQKFESGIRPLVMLNLIITSLLDLPLLLMSPLWLLNGALFYNYKYFNQHDFWIEAIEYGIPMIIWTISIIISIQGLKQKKLSKIKMYYLISSFCLILVALLVFISSAIIQH